MKVKYVPVNKRNIKKKKHDTNTENFGNFNQGDVKVKDVPVNKTNIRNKTKNTDTDNFGNCKEGNVKVKYFFGKKC